MLTSAIYIFDDTCDQMETEEQRSELTTVTAGNIRLQKILHELQLESNRLRERQDVITGNAISGGRKQEGHGESQTDLVIQSSVGEDFIARGLQFYPLTHTVS